MSTKPETQGEREELIRELEIIASTQWSGFFPGSTAGRMKGIVQKAAALLAADGKAGGEVVATVYTMEALVQDGFVMVPREPTPEMVEAARWEDGEHTARAVYAAMIAAAPKGQETGA